MHTLRKIKLFNIALWITYPFALLLVYPLAMLRKKEAGKLFFFFDRYSMGGAQRVHLDILHAIADAQKQVYFTRTSQDNLCRDEFYSIANTDIREVQFWCENLFLRLFAVHYFAFYINRHKQAQIFSSNCTFFYDMLPFLAKHITTTELLHSFSNQPNGMEFFGLGTCKYLTHRVVIDNKSYSSIRKQYEDFHIDSSYFNRVQFIENAVDVPVTMQKDYSLPVKVLYAGRGGAEKRVDRIDRIAKRCMKLQLPVQFHFAGDDTMEARLSDEVKAHAVIHGHVNGKKAMYELYSQCHVVIITSEYEGFPMVVKEGMTCGCIPLVTALEGMMHHLQHDKNALIMFHIHDDDKLVEEGAALIKKLAEDSSFLKKMSENSYQYAVDNFNKANFIKAYRQLFGLS